MTDLKKYDKYLYLDKKLNGIKIVKRQSPFLRTKSFNIITIKNQFLGSGLWLITRLKKMDNQRIDIVSRAINNNKKLQRKDIKKDSNNLRTHYEVAEFLTKTII